MFEEPNVSEQNCISPTPGPQRQIYCPSEVSYDMETFSNGTPAATVTRTEPSSAFLPGPSSAVDCATDNSSQRQNPYSDGNETVLPKKKPAILQLDNLEMNGIYPCDDSYPMSQYVARHWVDICNEGSASDETLSPDQLEAVLSTLDDFRNRGVSHDDFQQFMQETAFPPSTDPAYRRGGSALLQRNASARMSPHVTVGTIPPPTPDLTYGYPLSVFAPMPARLAFPPANDRGLYFPFLTVRFTAAKYRGGGVSKDTYRCSSAAACCVKAIKPLCGSVPDIVYAFAVYSDVAELYSCWGSGYKEGYLVRRVTCMSISNAAGFLEFRRLIRNILQWGTGSRLDAIKANANVFWHHGLPVEESGIGRSGGYPVRIVPRPTYFGARNPDGITRKQRRPRRRPRTRPPAPARPPSSRPTPGPARPAPSLLPGVLGVAAAM